MSLKWIGSILIFLACGGFGFGLAAAHKREEESLRQLIRGLDYMECELQFRLTPLPELCRQAARESGGSVRKIFTVFAEELDSQVSPDVESCMNAALARAGDMPKLTRKGMESLGRSLGRFDIEGQLKGLEAVRGECRRELEGVSQNRDARLRCYQTLGVCAGAALAILLI